MMDKNTANSQSGTEDSRVKWLGDNLRSLAGRAHLRQTNAGRGYQKWTGVNSIIDWSNEMMALTSTQQRGEPS